MNEKLARLFHSIHSASVCILLHLNVPYHDNSEFFEPKTTTNPLKPNRLSRIPSTECDECRRNAGKPSKHFWCTLCQR